MDHVRVMWRALGALLALLVAGSAWGGVTMSQFPPNPGVMPGGGWQWGSNTNFGDPPPPRAWTNGNYGGVPGSKLTVPSTVQGPGGPLTVQVGRSASNLAIGRAAAVALKTLPWVAVGVALWDIWDELDIHPDGAGGLLEDPRTEMETTPGFKCQFGGGSWGHGTSPLGACVASAQANSSTVNYGTHRISNSYAVTECQGVGCAGTVTSACTWSAGGSCGVTVGPMSGSATPVPIQQCPASVDASNPAFSLPAGLPPDENGRCATARYNHNPMSEDQAGAKFAANPPADPGAVADDVIERGGEIQGEPAGITGPATQPGQSSTTSTQNPDGTTTTTTKTPTHNFTYGPNTMTWNTTITTVINNNGDITTTVENPPPAPAPETDPENHCVQNPDTVGCLKVDTVEAPPFDPEEKQVEWQPQAGWGADAGACPPPAVVSVLGQSITVDNTLVCDFLSGVRFAVIGAFGLVAALVFIGGFRE